MRAYQEVNQPTRPPNARECGRARGSRTPLNLSYRGITHQTGTKPLGEHIVTATADAATMGPAATMGASRTDAGASSASNTQLPTSNSGPPPFRGAPSSVLAPAVAAGQTVATVDQQRLSSAARYEPAGDDTLRRAGALRVGMDGLVIGAAQQVAAALERAAPADEEMARSDGFNQTLDRHVVGDERRLALVSPPTNRCCCWIYCHQC